MKKGHNKTVNNVWVASLLTAIAIALSACASQPVPLTQAENYQAALTAITSAEPELIAFRHDLHRYPELAGNERRTSSKVSEKLIALGYDVQTNIGGYGVVAMLKGKYDGPLVAFRADMDAVAGEALDPVPYASLVDGVHHTCGHDIHTTIGIGIAEGFAAIRESLSGSVMLIFHPAEEAGTGAEAMLADGFFEIQTPKSIFAVHTAPFDVGQLAVKPNGMLAGRTDVNVTLSGTGDLEAATSGVRDALTSIGDVTYANMLDFQTNPFVFVDLARRTPAKNQQAIIRAFVMSAGLADRPRVEAAIKAAVNSVQVEGVDISLQLSQALEGVNNDAQLVTRASAGIVEHAPELQVLPVPGVVPAFSEDFGSFQRSVPGVMFFVGVNNPEKGTIGFPHSPDFVADDSAILVGIKAMLGTILGELSQSSLKTNSQPNNTQPSTRGWKNF